MAEVSHGMNLLPLGQHQIQLKYPPPPGTVQVYEGSSVTLNWSYSLTPGLGFGAIRLNMTGRIMHAL